MNSSPRKVLQSRSRENGKQARSARIPVFFIHCRHLGEFTYEIGNELDKKLSYELIIQFPKYSFTQSDKVNENPSNLVNLHPINRNKRKTNYARETHIYIYMHFCDLHIRNSEN